MGFIQVGRAEIDTTDLGEAAFHGRDVLPVDFAAEGSAPLEGALYGGHLELARAILRAGSPVREETYHIAHYYLREFLAELPPKPELIARLDREARQYEFLLAILNEDVAKVERCLKDGVAVDEPRLITHALGKQAAIHYAVRYGQLAILELLVGAGANVDLPDSEGRSPLHAVAMNPVLSRILRRRLARYLRRQGAHFVPAISGWRAFWLFAFGISV